MGFKNIDIRNSYISLGEENIAKSFITPLLKESILYQRCVGFFSSSVFESILDGVVELARNAGKIQLISSPELSQEDIKAIELGYEQRGKIISNSFDKTFVEEINNISEDRLKLIIDLISKNILDIKLAVPNSCGIYHDKLGVFKDEEENVVVFVGSANSSNNAYKQNYEKIRVFKSWGINGKQSIEDEIEEFENLWNNQNEFVKVYDYTESAKKNIIKVINNKTSNQSKMVVKLRDYQEEAIEAWVSNAYHGFFVMATGTGKTLTAIYAAKRLLEFHKSLIVISAPYKHLIRQWSEDLEKIFNDAKIILVSSENPKWEQDINHAKIGYECGDTKQIIIVTTIASFYKDRFTSLINAFTIEKLLIVDEAHRFTNRPESLLNDYCYLLGLSATPTSGSNTSKGKELMDFFGGCVFNLPIEIALEKGFLVPYYYRPIYVYSNEEEEQKFQSYTQSMMSCFSNGQCIDVERFNIARRNRLRVISMANEKTEKLRDFIQLIKEQKHFVVYCGDGHLFDNEGNEKRHIQFVKKTLSDLGYKSSQFTAKENMKERAELVDAFNKGEIDALVAIRCLDEGINIPSIESALIISSNDDYREFVQRRGRILRLYKNKKTATIYDVVVLPSRNCQNWAKIEFRRVYEYAKLSINKEELLPKILKKLDYYDLSLDDVNIFENIVEDGIIDE